MELPGATAVELPGATGAQPSCVQVDTRHGLGGLRVVRSFEDPADAAGGVVMRFSVSVDANASEGVRLTGLGFSMVSDNTFGGLNTTQVAAALSFMDPHVGAGRGWHTWARADGSRSLVATPYGACPFEAYRPVFEDAGWTQMGTFEWTAHSAGWAEQWAVQRQSPLDGFQDPPGPWPHPKSPWPSWHGSETVYIPDRAHARQWHAPTSLELSPGERKTYALRLALAPAGPSSRDAALLAAGQPAVHGLPGYVLSPQMSEGGAFLLVELPEGLGVASARSASPEVLEVAPPRTAAAPPRPSPVEAAAGEAGGPRVASMAVTPKAAGRARVELTYSDGSVGSAHYLVVPAPSLQAHVSRYGSFAAETAWLPAEADDPFGRQSSLLAWDREDKRHVLQDGRAFVAGLSDDAGGAPALGLAAKSMFAPAAAELERLDEYVAETLFGRKNSSALATPHFSLQNLRSYRIRMTVFYFWYSDDYKTALQHSFVGHPSYYTELDKCTIGPSWCAFNAINSQSPPSWGPADYRQYNFPHQCSVYHALYLAARNHDLLPARTLRRPWQWYLTQAAATTLSLGCCSAWGADVEDAAQWQCTCVPTVGLMDGTIFREVLLALQAEAKEAEAAELAEAEAAASAPPPPPPPYTWVSGSLVAGNDRPNSPRVMTIAEAEAACDADKLCAGFTYHSSSKAPPQPLQIYLKGPTVSASADASWSHYLKPQPPGANPLTNHSWRLYADLVHGMMRNRTLVGTKPGQVPWNEMDAPYGSEFNWDTTGQEEVGVWGAFFNASSADPHKGSLQKRAVDSILAYMPSTPNFGYHGSAGGWGDFSNNGKWMVRGGWEREGGHYRAGLNSIPLAERFRAYPDELYLLEVAMGGMTGVLGNIDADGAPSMAFHLYPFMLEYGESAPEG